MQDQNHTESVLREGTEAKSDDAATNEEGLNKRELDLLRRICELCGACGNTAAAMEAVSVPSISVATAIDVKAANTRPSVCLCDRQCLPLPSPLTNLRDCYDRLLNVLLWQPPQQPSVGECARLPSPVRRRGRSSQAPPNRTGCAKKRRELATLAQTSLPKRIAMDAAISDAMLVQRLRAVSAAVFDTSFRLRLRAADSSGQLREACARLVEITNTMTKRARLHDVSAVRNGAVAQALRLLTYIFRQLSADKSTQEVIVEQRVHMTLVPLLSSRDATTQTNALWAIDSMTWRVECAQALSKSNCVERLVAILEGRDRQRRRLAANVLQALSTERQAAQTLHMCGGIPILLRRLHGKDLHTLKAVAYCLRNLALDDLLARAIRDAGAIPILLSHLRTQAPSKLGGVNNYIDRWAEIPNGNLNSLDTSPPTPTKLRTSSSGSEGFFEDCTSAEDQDDPTREKTTERIRRLQLKAGCCATLAELVNDNRSAQIIVLANGIHLVTKSCLAAEHDRELATITSPDQGCSIPERELADAEAEAGRMLQVNASRVVRHLYADERYRSTLRKLLPTSVLSALVDVASHARSRRAYDGVVAAINALPAEQLAAFSSRLDGLQQLSREPIRMVRNFEIIEALGSGAFGCVYKVRRSLPDDEEAEVHGNGRRQQPGRRQNSSFSAEASIYALKEVPLRTDKHDEHGLSELKIIKEMLSHPNIVEYYQAFVDGGKLYVLMEFIEGVPLSTELKFRREHKKRFSEKKVWHFFMQIVMALRYLHKEKHVVHRDLTPSNIMLTNGNKVTITDFGLARKRRPDEEVMRSNVGTLLYSCPEIVTSNSYDEKADIWSAGCILYHMCALEPPFDETNLLSLAMRIASGLYKPMQDASEYSNQIHETVARCMTVDPVMRPDVIALASTLTNQLMCHVDRTSRREAFLERRVEQASQVLCPRLPPFAGRGESTPRLGQVEPSSSDDYSDDDGRSNDGDSEENDDKEDLLTEDEDHSSWSPVGSSRLLASPIPIEFLEDAIDYRSVPPASASTVAAPSDSALARSVGQTTVGPARNFAVQGAIHKATPVASDISQGPQAAAAAARSSSKLDESRRYSALDRNSEWSSSSISINGSRGGSSASDGDDDVFIKGCYGARSQVAMRHGDGEAAVAVAASTAFVHPTTSETAVKTQEEAAVKTREEAAVKTTSAAAKTPQLPTAIRRDAAGIVSKPACSINGKQAMAVTNKSMEQAAPIAKAYASKHVGKATTMGARSVSATAPQLHGVSTASAASANPNAATTAKLLTSHQPDVSTNLLRVRLPQSSLIPIVDPANILLQVISKLEYLTQLQPTERFCPRRHLVDVFKRWLFTRGRHSPDWLKEELRKYVNLSRELVDIPLEASLVRELVRKFAFGDRRTAARIGVTQGERRGVGARKNRKLPSLHSADDCLDEDASATGAVGATYELVHTVVESLLHESGYYKEAQRQRRVGAVQDRV